jgi:hypothetical protein
MNNDVIEYSEFHCSKCNQNFEQLVLLGVSVVCPGCRTAISISKVARKFGVSFAESLIAGALIFVGYKAIKGKRYF